MPRFIDLIFYLNNSKIKLFLQKNAKISSGSAPRPPLASGGWGSAPDPQNNPHHCEFLAMPLYCIMFTKRLDEELRLQLSGQKA